MNIQPVQYSGWPEAYRCAAGPLELTVVTSIGPRILSLRFDGGENLLYEDYTGFSVGDWRLYGGHRFTIAPESDASYVPDNQPCQVTVGSDSLRIEQRLQDGLFRGLEIMPGSGDAALRLRHTLRNERDKAWHGAIWAITCVPPTGRIVAHKMKEPARFWPVPTGSRADDAAGQWRVGNDRVDIKPSGERGKIGLRAACPWLAWLRPDATLVVRGPYRVPESAYPDGGCNVEFYTCAHYVELETLGPLTTLSPGQELAHEQQWTLFETQFP